MRLANPATQPVTVSSSSSSLFTFILGVQKFQVSFEQYFVFQFQVLFFLYQRVMVDKHVLLCHRRLKTSKNWRELDYEIGPFLFDKTFNFS